MEIGKWVQSGLHPEWGEGRVEKRLAGSFLEVEFVRAGVQRGVTVGWHSLKIIPPPADSQNGTISPTALFQERKKPARLRNGEDVDVFHHNFSEVENEAARIRRRELASDNHDGARSK